jgi:hypothetical protein
MWGFCGGGLKGGAAAHSRTRCWLALQSQPFNVDHTLQASLVPTSHAMLNIQTGPTRRQKT